MSFFALFNINEAVRRVWHVVLDVNYFRSAFLKDVRVRWGVLQVFIRFLHGLFLRVCGHWLPLSV